MLFKMMATFAAGVELTYALEKGFGVVLVVLGWAHGVVGSYGVNKGPTSLSQLFLRRGFGMSIGLLRSALLGALGARHGEE